VWQGYLGQTPDFYMEQISTHISAPGIPADSLQTAVSLSLH
jgi:hypothetical protein